MNLPLLRRRGVVGGLPRKRFRDFVFRPRAFAEFVDVEHVAWDGVFRQLDQVGVMREENHLRFPGQLGQDFEGGAGSSVVEVGEKVVRDEWKGRMAVEVVLEGCQTKREVKLVAGSLAHALDRYDLAIAAALDATEDWFAGGVIVFQKIDERSEGESREELARATQDRALVSLAVPLDGASQHPAGQDELGVLFNPV